MADRDDIYRWLQGATFRHTTLDMRKIIEGLISEGRAEWVNPWNRARAIPNPVAKPKRDYKTENVKLRRVVDAARDAVDCVDEEDKRDALRAALAALSNGETKERSNG